MRLHALRRIALRLASSSVAAAGAAALQSFAFAEEAAPAASEADEKKKTCLNMTLTVESSKAVLSCYPAEYSQVIADRVLIRPCMTEANDAAPLRPLAVVEDGFSQSMLLVPSVPLWHGPPDAGATGRVGYPVLPISYEEPEPEAPPATSPQNGEGGSASTVASADEQPAPPVADPEAPTLWEQIEEPWSMLEAAGVLSIERDESLMPVRLALPDGAVAWQGELRPSPNHVPANGPPTRTVTVRLIGEDASNRLALRGHAAAPECGFCKFMKAGPCREEFIAWEACVDAARDANEDFIERCGKPTLALKACTDAHPEYYGALSDGPRGEEDEEDKEA